MIMKFKMNFTLLLISIIAMLLATGQASATEWIIEGDSVYVNDSNAYISVSPHTLSGSGDIIVNLTSKKYTGDIDVIFGFDTNSVKPTSSGLYNPTYSNVTKSYTCVPPNWYNYTLSPKVFNCWNNQSIPTTNNITNITTYLNSTILIYNHSFETANMTAKTAYWNETIFTEYTDVSTAFTKLNYDYGGMNTWYFRRNVPVIANQSKQLKVAVQVPIELGQNSGKYWVAIKPSDEALATAIANGHLYILDPWWNTSYFKTPLLINNTGNASILTNFQVRLNLTYNSNYMDANFTSLHLVNETSNTEMTGKFWIYRNNSVNGSYANIWLNLSSIPASVWDNTTYALYHRNVTEVDGSNFNGTFLGGGEYTGTVIDTAKWTVVGTKITQNNQLNVSGNANWGGEGISSVANFTRPFIWETDFRTDDALAGVIVGIKDTTAGVSYIDFVYGLNFDSEGIITAKEDGTNRGTIGTFSINTNYKLKIEVLAQGAKYYNSTNNGTTWNLRYSSSYSTEAPLKIGAAQYHINKYTLLDNTFVRKTTGFVDPTVQAGTTTAPPSLQRVQVIISG